MMPTRIIPCKRHGIEHCGACPRTFEVSLAEITRLRACEQQLLYIRKQLRILTEDTA